MNKNKPIKGSYVYHDWNGNRVHKHIGKILEVYPQQNYSYDYQVLWCELGFTDNCKGHKNGKWYKQSWHESKHEKILKSIKLIEHLYG